MTPKVSAGKLTGADCGLKTAVCDSL